jgi:hypothetical protein
VLVLDRNYEPRGIRWLPEHHHAIYANPLRGVGMAHAAFMARTTWWRSHPYNEANVTCEDFELWLSSRADSNFANLPEPLYFYREFESFLLSRYLQRKRDLARFIWRRARAEFGTFMTTLECVRQYAHIGAYALAGMFGITSLLLGRRNRSLDESARSEFREVIQRVLSTPLPFANQ